MPEDLAIPYLLALPSGSHPLHPLLSRSRTNLIQGKLDAALDAAAQAYEMARGRYDRYAGALSLVLRADALRRQMRWEDGLDALRHALHWLELDVAPVARYNEAVAVYLEGVVHYTLRADEKASATFAYAQSTLSESERHWAYEQHMRRAADCRNLIYWLTQLETLQETEGLAPFLWVMPVYELANERLIRTGAIAFPPFRPMIPVEVAARYCPPEVRLLRSVDITDSSADITDSSVNTTDSSVALSLLEPSLDCQYAAIRFADVASLKAAAGMDDVDVHMGDMLILEVAGGGAGSGELMLTWDRPFVRSEAGRVAFRTTLGAVDSASSGGSSGLIGIPKVLIKDVEAS